MPEVDQKPFLLLRLMLKRDGSVWAGLRAWTEHRALIGLLRCGLIRWALVVAVQKAATLGVRDMWA